MKAFDCLSMLTKDEKEFVKNSGDKDLKKRMRTFKFMRGLIWVSVPIASWAAVDNTIDNARSHSKRYELANRVREEMLNEQLDKQEITKEEYDAAIKEIERDTKKFKNNMKIEAGIKCVSATISSSLIAAVAINTIDFTAQGVVHDAIDESNKRKEIEESNPAETMKKFISGGNKKSES